MNQAINPYQSPLSTAEDGDIRLRFDGVIEEKDYICLLPHREFESVLLTTLFALLLSISFLFVVVVAAGIILRGWNNIVIPAAIVEAVLAIVAVLLRKFITASRRARGKLKQHSDLLGIARGEVNKNGIAFFDGKRQHWFGPHHLLTSASTKNGLRVRLDADPYRYLSLTKRLFDFYDASLARHLQQQWKNAAASVTADEPSGIDFWRELCPIPDDAIPYRGTIAIQQPMKTPQNRKNAISESVASVVLVCMGMFGKDVFHPWIAYGMVGWGVVAALSSVRIWWKYFRGVHTQAWSQQGWISPFELAFALGSHGVRISLNEVRSCTDHGNLVVLSTISGGNFYLARDHVASDEEWTRITNQTSGMVGDSLP